MKRLSDLPNIGKTLEKRLESAGIKDPEALMRAGSREAFKRLRQLEGDTCFNTLCALEGAVQGIRWHDLPPDAKAELKSFFDSFK
ncbi:MAG: TfoX/Sxy family protein [Oscillospiraceae bacterium]|jgi:DNA transformation protein